MAHISHLEEFNNNRKHELIKVKNINNEIILFSKEEALEALIKYISDDLNFLGNRIAFDKKNELDNKVALKLNSIEKSLLKHIDDKMNKISEKIISSTISRVIEEEVEKRVDIKLKKIKDAL